MDIKLTNLNIFLLAATIVLCCIGRLDCTVSSKPSYADPEARNDYINDPIALEHCVQLNKTEVRDYLPARIYYKAEYRNQKCTLACDYENHLTISHAGYGGMWTTPWIYNATHNFNVNEGQPCAADRGVCRSGSCHYEGSNVGNLTINMNRHSFVLNPLIYKVGTFSQCNKREGNANSSSVVACISSRNPNVTTLKSISGFTGNDYFYDHPDRTPLKMCDLVYCYLTMDYDAERYGQPYRCHYGTQLLGLNYNINFIFQKFEEGCILDVIQMPLSELVQDHGKRQAKVLDFAHIDVRMNVTLEWNGIIP